MNSFFLKFNNNTQISFGGTPLHFYKLEMNTDDFLSYWFNLIFLSHSNVFYFVLKVLCGLKQVSLSVSFTTVLIWQLMIQLCRIRNATPIVSQSHIVSFNNI